MHFYGEETVAIIAFQRDPQSKQSTANNRLILIHYKHQVCLWSNDLNRCKSIQQPYTASMFFYRIKKKYNER